MERNENENKGQKEQQQEDEEKQMNEYILEYIKSLDETETLVLEIAKEHLESSFCIERSVGFVKWLKDKEKEKEKQIK
jgi:hypothetical protein